MAKKKKKNKKAVNIASFYEVKGNDLTKKQKNCPKCGPGIFLADHGTRIYCGKCHYTEFMKKSEA